MGIACCYLEPVSNTRIEAKESLSAAVGLDHLFTICLPQGIRSNNHMANIWITKAVQQLGFNGSLTQPLTSLVPFGRSQSAEEHIVAPLGGHQFRGWASAKQHSKVKLRQPFQRFPCKNGHYFGGIPGIPPFSDPSGEWDERTWRNQLESTGEMIFLSEDQ